MKKTICFLLLSAVCAFSQQNNQLQVGAGTLRLPSIVAEPPQLTKFNLDFPGGNPKQLVAAIEKATGRPLNVIIPDEYANESIPALKLNQVTVAELFRAMEQSSVRTEFFRTGRMPFGGGRGGAYSSQERQTFIAFQTGEPISDDSIWYFRGRQKEPDFSAWEEKPDPPKTSRFYALTPYLEQGFKVEDITTAIQTGWKMLGELDTPSISFHKDTKLLIAVGEPGKLETIDAVLNALRPVPPSPSERLEARRRQATELASPLKPNASIPKPVPTPETEP